MVMKQEISALMDGEIDARAADALIQQVGRDHELEDFWATYHLIGDALRERCTHRAGLQTKIYARLAAEPTVLAPKARRTWVTRRGLRMSVAAAASVATISIAVWMAGRDQSIGLNTAQTTPAQFSSANSSLLQPALTPAVTAEMNEYLQAHQEYSPSGYQLATMRTAGAFGR
jgi:sigma-E factor negative regulatory protein RseA